MKLEVNNLVGTTVLLEVDVKDSDKLLQSDTIIVPEAVDKANKERVAFSTEIGKVVKMGDLAFVKFYDELPCHVGDKVMIVPNTGYLFHDEKNDRWLRIVKDVDIIAVLN